MVVMKAERSVSETVEMMVLCSVDLMVDKLVVWSAELKVVKLVEKLVV